MVHNIIPTELLGDFLQIENFFSTFKEELVAFGTLPSEMNKTIIYISMVSLSLCSQVKVMMESSVEC